MADDSGVNKEYKDRLFNFIFGSEENKAWTLSLYNAVNGSSYTNPDDMILKLSDSFPEGSESDIEAKVRMINVNYGRSKQTIDACKPLYEYSRLIQTIRDYKKTINEIEKAVDKAITDMPDDYILKQFLVTHRAEVNGMLVTEYNEEETMERFKEDGVKEERMRVLVSLMKTNNWTPERAVDSIMIPNNQREIYIAKLKKRKT